MLYFVYALFISQVNFLELAAVLLQKGALVCEQCHHTIQKIPLKLLIYLITKEK